MENKNNIFRGDFLPWIIKWGRATNLLGVVLAFGPCLMLALMGIWPNWTALAACAAVQIPGLIVTQIREPISFFTVLGVPGTYMAFLSGNISNMRVPCASIATKSAGYAEGSDEGTITATIGIAISTFVSTIFLTIGVIAGSWLLSILPPVVTQILNLLLPALFATLLVNYIWMRPKFGVMWTPVCFVMYWMYLQGFFGFTTLSTAFVPIFCAFGAMGLGVVGTNKGWW
ncbi:MAG: hypothetical protein IKU27_03500 [Clostridia bacterium]|nr:hypothetical protein [Clostridia bacterium]